MQTAVGENIYSFATFRIDTAKRILLENGEAVALNPKAFDLLLTLVERRGEIVSKDELLDAVWENQFVEQNNITVHISALRKIFGETKNEHRFIATVPGKGYKFVAEIQSSNGEKAHPMQAELLPSVFYEEETLVGREREIAEIINLLRGDAANLITLTGAGGTGKTRIARAIGSEAAADFPDGIFFVELAAVSDAKLVIAAIADTLGVKESGTSELFETLKDFLRERRALLILDNFEQLISAAPRVNEISAVSPLLKILITSRVALATKNEREFAVTPLAVPPRETTLSADKLAGYAAAALFIRRAQFVKSNFVLTNENAHPIAEICRRLDGLPLAIELAAARARLLAPSAILQRLEHSLNLLTGGAKNLSARQRTVRGAIEWSYDLLDEDEKILFRQLAIFAGGFTVEAAESVVSCPLSVVKDKQQPKAHNGQLTIDVLASLIDNNLLAQVEQTDCGSRLRMLEVVREYAAERLDAGGELEELQKNHARFFLALAEEAEPFLLGETAAKWLEKLETEHDNLRAALRWSVENDNESLIRLAAALRHFWLNHSHLSEGLGWLEAALEATENRISEARFKLLAATGVFLRNLGEDESIQKIYEKILAEGEEISDTAQIIKANHGLSSIALLQNDYAAAQKFLEEALLVSREIGDESMIAYTLCALGDLEMSKENLRAARPLLEESLTLSKKLGNRQLLNTTCLNLGMIDYLENSWNEAAFNFAESLRIARETGNKMLISCSLDGFAALALAGGNYAQSARIAGAAENLREATGYEPEPAEKIFREKYLARTRAALAPEDFTDAYQSGRNLDFSESIALTEATEFDFTAAFDENASEIVIEQRRVSRIVIEEEENEEEEQKGRKEEREKGRFPGNSLLFSPSTFLPFLLLALAVIGGYIWLNRQTLFSAAAPFTKNSIRQLTTSGKVGLAAISPDGKLFAYTIDDTGQKSLWLGFVYGGNHLPLRPAATAVYRTLAFSPDGNHLYFSIIDEQNPKSALYKMPVSGGVPVKVLDEIGHFALSPDGKRIAIARRDDETGRDFLVAAALDGSERRDTASFPKEFSFYFDTISWSADGKRFAVSAVKDSKIYQHEIAVVNAETGEIERISPPQLREINKTAWLDDGSGLLVTAVEHDSHASVPQYLIYHVAYPSGETTAITADRSNYGASWHNDAGASLGISAANDLLLAVEHRQLSNVWVAPTDDLSTARQITFSSFGKYDGLWGLDWTPDGHLIYTTSDTRSQYLSKMNHDGGEQQELTAPGAVDSILTVSNDGRYVFFQSNRGGDYDVWRMNTDGANMKQLTFGGKAFHPAPAPDGRWVYYKSSLKNIGELCRVPVDGGEPECLNDKSTSWGSFSPDGNFFAASYLTDKQRLAIFSAETNTLVKQFDLPKGGTLYMGSRWSPDSLAVVYRDTAFGYWSQPVEGGEPRRLEGLPKEKFYNFAFSKDGRQFAFVRGTEIRDVVLITNDK